MAIFLNNNVGLKIATVDLSDHVTSFTLNRVSDQLEVTAMGDTAHKFVSGLSADTITVSFLNDTAAGSVLATLQAAYGTTVAFTALQDKTAAVSATNVLYTGTILVDNLTDINGAVADEAMMDVTFTCNSKTIVATTGSF
jgi:aconitase B